MPCPRKCDPAAPTVELPTTVPTSYASPFQLLLEKSWIPFQIVVAPPSPPAKSKTPDTAATGAPRVTAPTARAPTPSAPTAPTASPLPKHKAAEAPLSPSGSVKFVGLFQT